MPVDRCLIKEFEVATELQKTGIGRKRVSELMALFRRRYQHHAQSMPIAYAWEQAALDTHKAAAHQLKQKKRRYGMQVAAQRNVQSIIDANPGNERRAGESMLSHDPRGGFTNTNVQMAQRGLRQNVGAMMADFLSQFRSKAAGFARDKAGLPNIVRELFGESTGDTAASQMARAVAEGMEYLRVEFNRSGGNIAKLERWGLPQSHDAIRVGQAEPQEWKQFLLPLLDRDRMLDTETGLPMDDARLDELLTQTYNRIKTDGLSDLRAGGGFGASVATRRQEHRFLIFRNADSWLQYQNAYGKTDPFTTIIHHIDAMTRDIALMQVLGPNPDATMRYMVKAIERAEAQSSLPITGKEFAARHRSFGTVEFRLMNQYDTITGSIHAGQDGWWAQANAGLRNLNVAAYLGGAMFSALTDRAFVGVTARLNGIPVVKTLARHLSLMTPTASGEAGRRMAARAGFVADGWTSQGIGASRYIGELVGPEWTRRAADTVLRVTGLSPWTDAGRTGFALEYLGMLTDASRLRYDQLDDVVQQALQRYGVTSADWDLYRSTQPWTDAETGATFIRTQDLLRAGGDRNREAAERIQRMILTETEFAVPTSGPRTQAMLTGGLVAGSVWGQIVRNVTQFKAFPVTVINLHLQRALTQRGAMSKVQYLAHLIIGTSIMGMVGEQMSQMAQGKDPLPMLPGPGIGRKELTKNWLKAALRGGGIGLFGDFLFQDQNRFGGGWLETLAGPVYGTNVAKLGQLTVGNLQQTIAGEDTRFASELVRFAHLLMPGRSIWYTRLALERLIVEEIEMMIDPDTFRRLKNMERRTRRETGQEYWVPPGQGWNMPRRGPNIGRALGE